MYVPTLLPVGVQWVEKPVTFGLTQRQGRGEPMSPLTYRERPHPTDQIYRCLGRKRHSHTCDMSAVYRSDIDAAVYAYFRDLGGDAEATREQLATQGRWNCSWRESS
jgi:hypothetical protein